MILIIDDDRRLRDLLTRFLTDQGFHVMASENTKDARTKLQVHQYSALVVDVMMPEEDGFSFVQSLKNKPPILFLTACDTLESKIQGFVSGGDDYLTKPFEPLELSYRLHAICKRTTVKEAIRLGDYLYLGGEVMHCKTKKPLVLSTLDMNLLSLLTAKPGHPVSRTDLSKHNRVDERTIDAQVNRLRKKLGDDPRNPRIIKTVRHIGYALATTGQF